MNEIRDSSPMFSSFLMKGRSISRAFTVLKRIDILYYRGRKISSLLKQWCELTIKIKQIEHKILKVASV